MNSTITIVARTSALIWRRELAAVLGMRERTLLVSLSVFGAAIVAFSMFLAWILGSFVSSLADVSPNLDQRSLLRLMFAGLLLGSSVYFLILCATLPPRDRLATALALLPVTRRQVAVGTLIPAMTLGLAVAFIFGLPALPMIIEMVDSGQFQISAPVAFIAMILLIAVLVPALFFTIRDLSLRLRIPIVYALAVAASLTLGFMLLVTGADLIPRPTIDENEMWTLLLPTRAISEVLQPGVSEFGRLVLSWLALLAWFALALGIGANLLRGTAPIEGRSVAVPSIRLAHRRAPWGPSYNFEIAVLTRLPQTIVTTVILFLSAVVLPLVYLQPEGRAAVEQVASLPVVVAFALGAYSFGSTRKVHWIAAVTAKPGLWIIPKPIAALTVSAAISAPYIFLMALAGLPVDKLIDMLAIATAMWATAMLTGVLVPFSIDQPLSATITSATTAGLWALSTFALRWAFGHAGIDSPIPPSVSWVVSALIVYGIIAANNRNRATTDA